MKSIHEKAYQNWMAEIRQTLQLQFESIEQGVWAVPIEAA